MYLSFYFRKSLINFLTILVAFNLLEESEHMLQFRIKGATNSEQHNTGHKCN
jgi:hypothetical protein